MDSNAPGPNRASMDSNAPGGNNRLSLDSNWDMQGEENNMSAMQTGDSSGIADAAARSAAGVWGGAECAPFSPNFVRPVPNTSCFHNPLTDTG